MVVVVGHHSEAPEQIRLRDNTVKTSCANLINQHLLLRGGLVRTIVASFAESADARASSRVVSGRARLRMHVGRCATVASWALAARLCLVREVVVGTGGTSNTRLRASGALIADTARLAVKHVSGASCVAERAGRARVLCRAVRVLRTVVALGARRLASSCETIGTGLARNAIVQRLTHLIRIVRARGTLHGLAEAGALGAVVVHRALRHATVFGRGCRVALPALRASKAMQLIVQSLAVGPSARWAWLLLCIRAAGWAVVALLARQTLVADHGLKRTVEARRAQVHGAQIADTLVRLVGALGSPRRAETALRAEVTRRADNALTHVRLTGHVSAISADWARVLTRV